MALKQKFAFLIVFAASCFSCFCFDFDSGINPFDVSSLLFDKEGVFVISQTINCTEDRIEINYVVKNSTDFEITVPAKFECVPLGDQRSVNDIAIPYGFKILINGKDAKFAVYNDNAQIKNYYENSFYNKKSEILFNMTIPSEEKTVVKVSYQNLQSAGTNQTGTNFKYLIKLQKNKNNEPIDYNFSYTASKEAEAYIENIIIFDSNDDTYPELDYQITRSPFFDTERIFRFESCQKRDFAAEQKIALDKRVFEKNSKLKLSRHSSDNFKRSFNDNNVWTFNITHHAFESDSMYIFVGLTYYDLLSDSTDIRMYRYKDMATLYVNDKDLKNEVLEMKDVFFLSNEQLRLLRSAFYAIHGYRFKSQALQNYFTQCGRYEPNSSFSEAEFNETERKNIGLIRQMECLKSPLLLSDCLE